MSHEATVEPSRLERKRSARAAAILDEAMAILSAEGIDALTLGRLARALDYVPAALYRYFDSKDALVAAMQRRAVSEVHEGLRAALGAIEARSANASAEVAILAKLVGGARYYLTLPRANPNVAFLIALLMGDPRPLLSDEESRRTAPHLAALLGDVRAMFAAATERGALDEGDDILRTLSFWAALQGALSLEKARRITTALPASAEVGRVAIASMLIGWGASPEAIERAERLVDDAAIVATPTPGRAVVRTESRARKKARV